MRVNALPSTLVALVLVAACNSSYTPAQSFVDYLAGYGQTFTPEMVPLSGVVPAQQVVAKLKADGWPPGAPVAEGQPIYGVVRCVDAPKGCGARGLVGPDETLAIWLVNYPEVSGSEPGTTSWATVDAASGDFINGDGPP